MMQLHKPKDPILAAMGRFGKFKSESEQQVRDIQVKPNHALETLKSFWERFDYTSMWERDEIVLSKYYDIARKLAKERPLSSHQIGEMTLVLKDLKMESIKMGTLEKNLQARKMGLLLSAMINESPDKDFTIVTLNLGILPRSLGYANVKDINVVGDVGEYLGERMKSGSITVDGNVCNQLLGSRYEGYIGSRMEGGIIRVKGNTGNNIAHWMSGGKLYLDGDMGDLLPRYPGALIYHKNKLVREGPFLGPDEM